MFTIQFSHMCTPPPHPEIESLDPCPMGNAFQNLRTGHYEHNNSAFSFSHYTLIIQEDIGKFNTISLSGHISPTRRSRNLDRGVMNFI